MVTRGCREEEQEDIQFGPVVYAFRGNRKKLGDSARFSNFEWR